MQVDKNGELTAAEQLDGSDPILEATLTNGVLRITTKEDSQDLIQFEMKLTLEAINRSGETSRTTHGAANLEPR